jgi:hypothetical protein
MVELVRKHDLLLKIRLDHMPKIFPLDNTLHAGIGEIILIMLK